jgi:site-specific DNA-methyltransferase (adenine-specific)
LGECADAHRAASPSGLNLAARVFVPAWHPFRGVRRVTVSILTGDCRERMAAMDAGSIDSCVTDPPYHLTSIVKRFSKSHLDVAAHKDMSKVKAPQYKRLAKGFMGQQWDGGDVAFQPETWAEVLRVLKPGAHLVAFSGTRTYHRMACAIEDAGFEIRDQLAWCYGSGFPKSHDTERAIAAATCPRDGRHFARQLPPEAERDAGDHVCETTPESAPWLGYGTALKPAWEPICLARKPLQGTVAANVQAHGTGALNIDGCRIDAPNKGWPETRRYAPGQMAGGMGDLRGQTVKTEDKSDIGRWPANIIHDGSDEVLAAFPETESGTFNGDRTTDKFRNTYGAFKGARSERGYEGNSGSAARFFYCAKATTEERGEGNNHPTVKPVDLMRWLCRLVTPKGGTVLDPFSGSGSTLVAADAEQFHAIGCELSPDYAAIAEHRIRAAAGMFADVRAA